MYFIGEIEPEATIDEIDNHFVQMDTDESQRIELRGNVERYYTSV